MQIKPVRLFLLTSMAATLSGCIISSEKSSSGNPVAPVTGTQSNGVERSVPDSNVKRLECIHDQVATGVEVQRDEAGNVTQVGVICAPLRVQRKPG